MTESEWPSSNDPMAMLRLATGKVSLCCGCIWCQNTDGTLSLGIGQQCCAKCDNAVPTQGFKPIASDHKLLLFACACCRQVWHRLDPIRRHAIEQAERCADGDLRPEELFRACANVKMGDIGDCTNAPAYLCHTPISMARQVLGNAGEYRRWPDGSEALQADLLRCIVGNPFRPVTLPPCRCPGCGWLSQLYVCPNCKRVGAHQWLTQTVLGIAQRIYDERDWASLPILADALEDAGCPAEVKCPECDGAGVVTVYPDYDSLAWDMGIEKEERHCATCGTPDPQGRRMHHRDGTGRIPNPILAHLRGPGPHARGCHVVDAVLGLN